MSYLLFLILLCLVLEYMDLLCLAVLNDIGGYGSFSMKMISPSETLYCFPPVLIIANTKSTSLSNAESDRRLADTGKPGKTGFL